MDKRGPAAYTAEFIGTFLLVLFIGLILTSNSQFGLGPTDFAVIGLLHVFVLAMLVATLGPTSGGHFNPAVTVTLAAMRKISIADAATYIVAQLAGAVAAALVVKVMLASPADAVNYGATSINDKLIPSDGAAFLAEAVGTFALMWAIMGTAVVPRGDRHWAPWMIGITLGFAVLAIGPLTGAGINPARAFGPALVGDAFNGAGQFLFVYVAGPILGALLAGFLFQAAILRGEHLDVGVRPIDTLRE